MTRAKWLKGLTEKDRLDIRMSYLAAWVKIALPTYAKGFQTIGDATEQAARSIRAFSAAIADFDRRQTEWKQGVD